jgi:predicted phosphodiesterase
MVVFGDSGKGTPEQSAIAQTIASEAAQPNLIMIVGDVIYPPADDASYDTRFFTPYRNLLPSIPFYAIPGNHDYEIQNGKPFFDVFTLPTNGPSGLPAESSYWLTRGGTQLIAHDTNQPVATLRSQSAPWHQTITRQPATFRLVFQHQAVYASGPNSLTDPVASWRQLLGPLYSSTGVDVVFNGHEHFYERTSPIGGVVYVTTGAGGAELYPRAAKNAWTAAFFNERHSYTYLEVSGRTLRLRQSDLNGQTVDTLTITKPVTAAEALRAFAGAGTPSPAWQEPGFDDSAWPEVGARGLASALHARRRFAMTSTEEATEAVLRVSGAADYLVRLNGLEVARGGGVDEPATAAFAVPVSLLRQGDNVLTLEGQVLGTEPAPPSLELSLYSSPRARQ